VKIVIISFPFWIGVVCGIVGLIIKIVYLRWTWFSTKKVWLRNLRVFGSLALLISEIVFFTGPFQRICERNGFLIKIVNGPFDIDINIKSPPRSCAHTGTAGWFLFVMLSNNNFRWTHELPI